jgi:hypothetical protein
MANRVFEDRLGIYIINAANVAHRLTSIRGLGIVDVFLPRTAEPAHFAAVKAAGLFSHLWTADDGLPAAEYANRTLLDIQRLKPGAGELNIELPSDPPLHSYIATTLELIRKVRPAMRLRINLAPWKGFGVGALDWTDHNLYVAAQNYEGNMDNLLSPADVLGNLLDYGVPRMRATVCYAAACRVLGSPDRLRTLPDLARLKRGVIFSDDLCANVGLLS